MLSEEPAESYLESFPQESASRRMNKKSKEIVIKYKILRVCLEKLPDRVCLYVSKKNSKTATFNCSEKILI